MHDVDATSRPSLYESDFYTWTQEQAELIRAGRLGAIDGANVAEEIESLGRSQAASLESAYRLICLHQLKRMFQPERDSRSWTPTIGRERLRAARLLRQNPGLKPKRDALFASAYADARAEAALETDLPLATFPRTPPFTLDEAASWSAPHQAGIVPPASSHVEDGGGGPCEAWWRGRRGAAAIRGIAGTANDRR